MDLNGLQFTPQQLTELYSNVLVVTGSGTLSTSTQTTSSPPKPSINFKGQNKKGIVWLVHEPGHVFLDDDDFEFLSQIVGACKMNMDDIALVNLAHVVQSVNEVVDVFKPSYVFLCGIEYQRLPFKLDAYIPYPHANCNYFLADSLQHLRNDKAKKMKLWLALKTMFSL